MIALSYNLILNQSNTRPPRAIVRLVWTSIHLPPFTWLIHDASFEQWTHKMLYSSCIGNLQIVWYVPWDLPIYKSINPFGVVMVTRLPPPSHRTTWGLHVVPREKEWLAGYLLLFFLPSVKTYSRRSLFQWPRYWWTPTCRKEIQPPQWNLLLSRKQESLQRSTQINGWKLLTNSR